MLLAAVALAGIDSTQIMGYSIRNVIADILTILVAVNEGPGAGEVIVVVLGMKIALIDSISIMPKHFIRLPGFWPVYLNFWAGFLQAQGLCLAGLLLSYVLDKPVGWGLFWLKQVLRLSSC